MLKSFLFFLKVGTISFGKMVATQHMMDEYVTKKKILREEDFFAINGFCKLLPGPSQTQMSIILGYLQGGVKQGIISGLGYLFPSWILITLAAYFTFEVKHLVPVDKIMYGLSILALVFLIEASLKLAKKSINSILSIVIFVGAGTLSYFKVDMIVILILSAFVGSVSYHKNKSSLNSVIPFWIFSPLLLEMFFFFMKIGLVIYGGGLVMIPFIQEEIVIQRAWLTEEEFLMGFAIGSATPGPVILTVAYFGYKVAMSLGYSGLFGSIIASVGVMLPSFVLILSFGKIILASPKIPWMSHMLQGIMPATLGAVVVVSLSLIKSTLVDPIQWGVFTFFTILLMVFKINPLWLLLCSVGLGFFFV